MIRLMAGFRIEEEASIIVLNAIREFVAAVNQAEPDTEYTSYQVAASNRFIHIMAFADQAAQQRHQNADYTARFVEVLYPNCSQLPEFTPLDIVE